MEKWFLPLYHVISLVAVVPVFLAWRAWLRLPPAARNRRAVTWASLIGLAASNILLFCFPEVVSTLIPDPAEVVPPYAFVLTLGVALLGPFTADEPRDAAGTAGAVLVTIWLFVLSAGT